MVKLMKMALICLIQPFNWFMFLDFTTSGKWETNSKVTVFVYIYLFLSLIDL